MSSEEEESWVSWFCSRKGNEFFCEIDEEYIQDDFNLTGLRNMVPHYDYALDLILDSDNDDVLTEEQQEVIEASAEILYGLIHARFIITARGLHLMLEKYQNGDFGRCPLVSCGQQPVLPVGESDCPRCYTVKVFCPRCQDIYTPRLTRHSTIDGAFFGTSFPHILFQVYPEYAPPISQSSYVPKIYGFKVHSSAYTVTLKARMEAKRRAPGN